MKRSQRAAMLTLLNREMLKRGSWCGETHLQKAAFFLQDLLRVDTGFDFILYRHGPFSFDLRDELASMQADSLLELEIKREGYGPTYVPTQFSEVFLQRFPKTTARYMKQIKFIAEELSDKGVAELERLATAFFIVDREGIHQIGHRSQRLVELKPHISAHEALAASEQVDRLIEKAVPFRLKEESFQPSE
ncbi:MAG TPA: hypothetical protein VH350_15270 [Candidatus Sulfotelmatobacter sp.]|nr:hypothetical protein [Candidatus Sulfotelmatobacter sp.]